MSAGEVIGVAAVQGFKAGRERWSVEIPQDPSDWMNQVGKYLDTPATGDVPMDEMVVHPKSDSSDYLDRPAPIYEGDEPAA